MEERRPNPDQLLRQIADEEQSARGKLTVFFGAAPGVGKTYAMLEAARAELEQEKRDVCVGIIETHGRYETAALVLGLELLSRRKLSHRGVEIDEFDLDAALARRPDLILVDELAHTNAEGVRHAKRWQDVEELLAAGIDVFSSMNVQHVESLNDVIAKITGVVVRETVPDSVLEQAYEVKLVDLPPDELQERLRDGKVYVPAQAERAIENFFRKGNLIALRELSLRLTADRVGAQMQAFRQAHGIEQTWAATDQLLVAISPSPYSASIIRAARRMAGALHARWFAVYVEPPTAGLSKAAAAQLSRNLQLAQQLGAEVVTLAGAGAAEAILRFARERNITKIILGKPRIARLRDRFRVSLVDRLVRDGRDIDVYVTAGDRDPEEVVPELQAPRSSRPSGFVAAAIAAACSTAVAWIGFGRDQLSDVVMIYLLGIMLVSSRYGLFSSLLAALLSVAAMDFFFVPPYLTFSVENLRYAVTFAVMFVVAAVISGLTQRVRNQADAARSREASTAALYELSRALSGAQEREQVMLLAKVHLERALGCRVAFFTKQADGSLERGFRNDNIEPTSEHELSVARWVFQHEREAGYGTNTLPSAGARYVPLRTSGGVVGVLALRPTGASQLDALEQRTQVAAFTAHVALALERAELAQETQKARREVEAEQLRSSLLSSVSHDLRTPLAVITGTASTLLEGKAISEATQQDLIRSILEESERLNRQIRNLLDMTRLESGAVQLRKEWLPFDEVIGATLHHLEARLQHRELRLNAPPELPLVPFDPMLAELVLTNLLENALKYGRDPLELSVTATPAEVLVEVADRGPGIPVGQSSRVFDKFHRAVPEGSGSGVGLGLAICRAVVVAHGGRIWADNREGGGASFRFTLPIQGAAPDLPADISGGAEPLQAT